jgi:predicted ester cyclase
MKRLTYYCLPLLLVSIFFNCQQPEAKAPEAAAKSLSAVDVAARNKANFIKQYELFNARKFNEIEAMFAPNFFDNTDKRKKEDLMPNWERLMKNFPDLTLTIEQIVSEGDMVMAKSEATATHSTPYLGSKPTNQKMSVAYWDCHRLDKDGLVLESWTLTDNLTLTQNLGLLPPAK